MNRKPPRRCAKGSKPGRTHLATAQAPDRRTNGRTADRAGDLSGLVRLVSELAKVAAEDADRQGGEA